MAGIMDIEYTLPEKLVTNEQLAAIFDKWSAKKYMRIQIASVYEKEIEEELLQRGIKNYIFYSEAELRLMNLKKYNISKEHPKVYHYYLNIKYYPANLVIVRCRKHY